MIAPCRVSHSVSVSVCRKGEGLVFESRDSAGKRQQALTSSSPESLEDDALCPQELRGCSLSGHPIPKTNVLNMSAKFWFTVMQRSSFKLHLQTSIAANNEFLRALRLETFYLPRNFGVSQLDFAAVLVGVFVSARAAVAQPS